MNLELLLPHNYAAHIVRTVTSMQAETADITVGQPTIQTLHEALQAFVQGQPTENIFAVQGNTLKPENPISLGLKHISYEQNSTSSGTEHIVSTGTIMISYEVPSTKGSPVNITISDNASMIDYRFCPKSIDTQSLESQQQTLIFQALVSLRCLGHPHVAGSYLANSEPFVELCQTRIETYLQHVDILKVGARA